jgi:aminomethyltransferase
VLDAGGAPIGEVTSGNFSPTLERAIALAFLPPGTEDGAAVQVELRGTPVPATVVKPPFVRP